MQTFRPDIPHQRDLVSPSALAELDAVVACVQPWPALLIGPVGSGKTCAALCVADCFGSRRYRTVAEMNLELIAAQNGELYAGGFRKSVQGWWADWIDAGVCILDEIGARERVSDAHYENVKRAIDSRHGRPLIAISNLDLDDIAHLYDDRIASRLSAGTVIRMVGEDRRLKRGAA